MEQPVLLFGWFRWDILVEYKDLFWQGAWMTLRMTVVCVLLGASWGLCLALARLAQCLPGEKVRLAPVVQETAHRKHIEYLRRFSA